MDKKFLEFLGNFFLATAEGKRKVDDMANWMKQGFSGFDELSAMFHQFYGLNRLSERNTEYEKMSKKAIQDFQASLKEYLEIMGIVPREEYFKLLKKYDTLKEKSEAQQETIKYLRLLLKGKGMDQSDMSKGLKNTMKSQTELFQKMMESFSQSISKKESDFSEKQPNVNNKNL